MIRMRSERILGVIGGSGLYALDALEDAKARQYATPWGEPSAPLTHGRLCGVRAVFIARHGDSHRLPPHAINYRANIDALKQAGATDVISVSACGSLREEMRPGDFVVVDQYVDRTTGREKTFFGPGFVAHVSLANPVCSALAAALTGACERAAVRAHPRGTYAAIDGPQFSSRAESDLHRAWGCDVVGMTNMPEAKLAREAELPYASLAMVTDYDCWRADEKAVEVADILAVMRRNTENARRVLLELAAVLGPERRLSPDGVETVLDHAVITPRGARDPEFTARLGTIAGRFLKAERPR
jgi:5'-methylthioadenosine phosphorylase